MTPPFLKAALMGDVPHGFFGREGGVSEGIYASLNCGPGSGDDPGVVAENRRRCADALGAATVVTAYQTHSAIAAYVDDVPRTQIEADALITDRPGLAIGCLAADCVPVLMAGGDLVAAAHAGWRGSLSGILEATVDLLERHGARRERLAVAIGPCLRAPDFEVGDDLVDTVTGQYPAADRFFEAKDIPAKHVFDHTGFVAWRLVEAGITPDRIEDVGGNTLAAPATWFSYRESRRRALADYGRNLSAIALPPS